MTDFDFDSSPTVMLNNTRTDMQMNVMRGLLHEMRNSLAAATGFVDMLSQVGELNDKQMNMLRQARRALYNTDGRVLNALDFAHTTQQHSVYAEAVPLNPLLERVMRNLTDVIAAKHIQASVESPASVIVWGDEHQLEQIISNLLGNAVKYNRDGGTIRLDVQRADDGLTLRVSDSGFGIRPEDQPHIFELNYRGQLHDETGRRLHVSGTGIGLWLVRLWVEQHRGTIDVQSQVGQGTTFTVWLPRHEEEVAAEAALQAEATMPDSRVPRSEAERNAERAAAPLRRAHASESVDTSELPRHEQADAVEDSSQEGSDTSERDPEDTTQQAMLAPKHRIVKLPETTRAAQRDESKKSPRSRKKSSG